MEEAQNIYSLRHTDKHSDTEIFLKKLSERNQYEILRFQVSFVVI